MHNTLTLTESLLREDGTLCENGGTKISTYEQSRILCGISGGDNEEIMPILKVNSCGLEGLE